MMAASGYGARCDQHVGEPFPSRCEACNIAVREAIDDRVRLRVRRHMPAVELLEDHLAKSSGNFDTALESFVAEVSEMLSRG